MQTTRGPELFLDRPQTMLGHKVFKGSFTILTFKIIMSQLGPTKSSLSRYIHQFGKINTFTFYYL